MSAAEPAPVEEHPLALALAAGGLGTAPIGLDGIAIACCPGCGARGFTLRLPPAPALPSCSGPRCSPARLALGFEVAATSAPSHRSILLKTATQIRATLAPLASPEADDLPLTDLGNARRLVAQHGGDIRYVPGLGWLIWDGRRWSPDVDGAVMRRAKATVDDMLREAIAALAAAASIADAHDRQELAAQAQRRVSHTLRSQAEPRLRAMVSLAETELPAIARAGDLDADPMLFCCATGTIELETGDQRGHRREDMITRLAPVAFHPDAPAPTWDRFLVDVLSDEDLIGYLRRAIGYALTARTDEQVITLLHGAGANGKSTLLGTVRAMLGDYAVHTDFATFVARERGGAARTDLMRLRGARLVTASEVGDGERLDERAVKDLTGGEPIVARHLYREEIEFAPVAKIWWAANHLPRVRGTDEGIWRRLRLVPFRRVIPAHQRDPGLGRRLLDELPGILAWAVRGCLEWQRVGLGRANQIEKATSSYRADSDRVGRWLADECELDPEARLTRGALRSAYESWCERERERPIGPRALAEELRRRGVEEVSGVRDGDRRERGWRGLRLHVDSCRQSATRLAGSEPLCGESAERVLTGVDVSTEGDGAL